MSKPRFVAWIFVVVVGGVSAGEVPNQDYPNKPIRIVTQAAGGGSDFTSRILSQGISGPLGQPVIVENRGNAVLLGEFLAKAPPDGYGLVVSGGSFWIGPLLQKMPYDVVRDSTPISLITKEVAVLVVHSSVPVKSVQELIALAKARPGQLNYGSSGIGGAPHLAAELFKSLAGVNIVHILYKGSAPRLTALMSGEIQMSIMEPGLAKSEKLRALAVTSAEPSALAPGLPTVAASGLPGYEAAGLTGIFAPAKTPAAIINRLNQDIVRVLGRAEVKEKFLNAGVETVGSTSEQFALTLKSDIAKWEKVIKDAGIKVD